LAIIVLSYFSYQMISFVAISSFLMTILGLPTLIKVAKLKRLVDEPGEERKIHHRSVPTIGGVMIFVALLFNFLFWSSFHFGSESTGMVGLSLVTASLILIFFMGLKDDIIGVSPSKKLLTHVVIGVILVGIGGFQIHSFSGLFGVQELLEPISIVFSVFVYIVIVNAFNLIDGIDGLAAGYSAVAMGAFAFWFLSTGAYSEAILALAAGGSMLGFLVFNFAPARIFMGDCGSLVIGLIGYVLSVQLMNTPTESIPDHLILVSKEVFAMGILAYPLVDTLRVFCLRAARGISPFHPDQNHLHHRLMMRFGTHQKTAVFVYVYSIVFCALPFLSSSFRSVLSNEAFFFLLLGLAFACFIPILRSTKSDLKTELKSD